MATSSLLFHSLFLILCFICIKVLALDCLKCHSNDPQGECKLGTRKNRPKIDRCYETGAKCYVLGNVNGDGFGEFERGCTTEADFCDSQNVEFCRTCGFNYCNYVVMELGAETEEYLQKEGGRDIEESLNNKENNRVIKKKFFRTVTDRQQQQHIHVKDRQQHIENVVDG